jgi:hypothetical protein
MAYGQPLIIADFMAHEVEEVLANWQSEWLQLATMVILTKVLIYQGSPQSRDGSDRIESKLDRLLVEFELHRPLPKDE